MLVTKEIIRPGTYFYTDQETQMPRRLVVSADGVKHMFEDGQKMLAAGLSIPVPLEHQPDAAPLTAAEKAAKQLLNNAGWVNKYELKDIQEDGKTVKDVLFGVLDIPDPAIVKKLPKTIRFSSPHISSFTDGNGNSWNNVISHLALTSRPRITKQQPFQSLSAAMAIAGNLAAGALVAPKNHGLSLSRAGLLVAGEAGALFPAYPVAFSLWSGAKLADEEVEKIKAKESEEKPKPKEDPEADTPLDIPADPLAGGIAPEKALVDADGDISVFEVITDLLEGLGWMLEGPVTKDNFAAKIYQAAMDKMKEQVKTPEPEVSMTNQPPTGANDLPTNPIIQEQPPMYMSLEQVNKITDPTLKQVALSLHAQQQEMEALKKNAFEGAKKRRQDRIDRLAKKLPQSARDQLVGQLQGATLSIGADGVVKDSLAVTLDILEAGIKDLPAMLTTQNAQFSELPHPREYSGEMTDERRKEVVAEMTRGLPALPTEPVAAR